ncbi:MAG: tetratricopeptide repeat protein, partial [Methanomassiliicoccales archaeon]|nr:tetratricopeptide repeat protein [Methanomassiliicoccales archaeon]
MSSSDARIAYGWMEEGDALFEKNDLEGAIEYYNKAFKLFPRDPNLLNRRGLAFAKLGRYEEAIKSYDAAIEHYPRDVTLWGNRG